MNLVSAGKAVTQYLTLSTGENIFYREAGLTTSPTILLLHSYPPSPHQYRNLIPILSPRYRVIAPDLTGFGFTTAPANDTYTFDSLASTISTFLTEIPTPPEKYSIYIFDYGAPTGFRFALKHPKSIQAIIPQNGNTHVEGLGAFCNTASVRDALRRFMELDGTIDPNSIAPESYTLDQYLLDRPGKKEIQLDLFYDYKTNVEKYPEWQAWFRSSHVLLLAVWGKNDPIFVKPGAEAYKTDLPKAGVHLLDAAHFAVDSHEKEIGALMVRFLKRHVI
ncbi:putative hydrolase [Ampelomyces quisqualis]|uniref:Putative hydrolase n=1 Tax=Ampelomyces quisqualis TaxID=50730 RepID=A0A6A5QBY7_AMPQU|nr:putative hydrolase [Ampelomyces quisqualis]